MATLSTTFIDNNDYIIIPGTLYNFERTTPFSVAFWFKCVQSSSTRTIIGNFSSTNIGWEITVDGSSNGGNIPGSISFQLCNTTTTNQLYSKTQTSYSTGTWKYITITYDGSSNTSGIVFYVDGVQVSSISVFNNLIGTTLNSDSLRLGMRQTTVNSFMGGGLYDVAIYNRVLTPVEVYQIYDDTNAIDLMSNLPSGLIGYWKLGDGDTYPTVLNSSTNAVNGTMTNMTTLNFIRDTISNITNVAFYDFPVGMGAPITYKMRALANPGPGYVTWIVQSNPDMSGSSAPTSVKIETITIASVFE